MLEAVGVVLRMFFDLTIDSLSPTPITYYWELPNA